MLGEGFPQYKNKNNKKEPDIRTAKYINNALDYFVLFQKQSKKKETENAVLFVSI